MAPRVAGAEILRVRFVEVVPRPIEYTFQVSSVYARQSAGPPVRGRRVRVRVRVRVSYSSEVVGCGEGSGEGAQPPPQ